MPHRSKLLINKSKKSEHELHILTNPYLNFQLRLLNRDNDDYQAPLTGHTLSPNSKWIKVRNNLHKIRSWGGIRASVGSRSDQDWYLFFQMSRELRRAQEQIRQVERRPGFIPVHYFYLPTDETHVRRYNVSHLRPSDALYHPGFGGEPIVLQSLLYYFTKECVVTYNSIFRTFLSDVCSIVSRDRERLNRAAVFRKVALTVAVTVFVIIGLMLFSLVLSVLKTTSDFKKMYADDPTGEIAWRQPATTFETIVNSF